MNIADKLEKWAKSSGGEVSLLSTISLKSEGLTISVAGVTLEDAFSKLKNVIAEEAPEKQKDIIPEKQEGYQKSTTAPQTITSVAPCSNASGDIASILQGRSLLRIYNIGEKLAEGESTVTIGSLQYVVK